LPSDDRGNKRFLMGAIRREKVEDNAGGRGVLTFDCHIQSARRGGRGRREKFMGITVGRGDE